MRSLDGSFKPCHKSAIGATCCHYIMNVLSLFDGISCARVALKRAGIPVKNYYASEVDKYAISISARNHPEIQHVGDVRDVGLLPDIDLVIFGSPCQDLSIAKKGRKGLEGERSGLFWEAVRILELNKPKWFVMENVASMPSHSKDTISRALGVEPVMINAALVSAQNRKRLFWANFPISQPADRGIVLSDILLPPAEVDERMVMNGKAFCLTATYSHANATPVGVQNSVDKKQRTLVKVGYIGEGEQYGQGGQAHRVYSDVGKSPTLGSSGCLVLGHIGNTNSQGNRGVSLNANAATGLYTIGRDVGRRLVDGVRADNSDAPITRRMELRTDNKCGTLTSVQKDNQVVGDGIIRKLTPVECERLQGLPDGYTEGVSNTQRYRCLGNAFQVDVVVHILKGLNII